MRNESIEVSMMGAPRARSARSSVWYGRGFGTVLTPSGSHSGAGALMARYSDRQSAAGARAPESLELYGAHYKAP